MPPAPPQVRRCSEAATCAHAAAAEKPVTIGSGKWTYTLDPTWGQLPSGMTYGFGCAVVVDSQDRVYVTSRSESPCVAVFDKDGKLLETWSKDFADKIQFSTAQVKATAHGLYWSKEPEGEFFYFTENVNKATGDGARVYKTDLAGKVLYELGKNVKAGAASQPFDFTNPTDVAVAPNGDIYIVDGYGSQLVYRFDKNFKHLKTIGGPGAEHGKFKTCHGVWVSTIGKEPEVYIADRGNGRLEVYSLDLQYKRTVPDMRPVLFLSTRRPSLRAGAERSRLDHRRRRQGGGAARRRQGCEEGSARPTSGSVRDAACAGGRLARRPVRRRMVALRPAAEV